MSTISLRQLEADRRAALRSRLSVLDFTLGDLPRVLIDEIIDTGDLSPLEGLVALAAQDADFGYDLRATYRLHFGNVPAVDAARALAQIAQPTPHTHPTTRKPPHMPITRAQAAQAGRGEIQPPARSMTDDLRALSNLGCGR